MYSRYPVNGREDDGCGQKRRKMNSESEVAELGTKNSVFIV